MPLTLVVADGMLAVIAINRHHKRLELNTVFFFGVAVGFLDIAYDILAVAIGLRRCFEHRLEQAFESHDMRADAELVEAGATAMPARFIQADGINIIVAAEGDGPRPPYHEAAEQAQTAWAGPRIGSAKGAWP